MNITPDNHSVHHPISSSEPIDDVPVDADEAEFLRQLELEAAKVADVISVEAIAGNVIAKGIEVEGEGAKTTGGAIVEKQEVREAKVDAAKVENVAVIDREAAVVERSEAVEAKVEAAEVEREGVDVRTNGVEDVKDAIGDRKEAVDAKIEGAKVEKEGDNVKAAGGVDVAAAVIDRDAAVVDKDAGGKVIAAAVLDRNAAVADRTTGVDLVNDGIVKRDTADVGIRDESAHRAVAARAVSDPALARAAPSMIAYIRAADSTDPSHAMLPGNCMVPANAKNVRLAQALYNPANGKWLAVPGSGLAAMYRKDPHFVFAFLHHGKIHRAGRISGVASRADFAALCRYYEMNEIALKAMEEERKAAKKALEARFKQADEKAYIEARVLSAKMMAERDQFCHELGQYTLNALRDNARKTSKRITNQQGIPKLRNRVALYSDNNAPLVQAAKNAVNQQIQHHKTAEQAVQAHNRPITARTL